jgi:hypothetical protein
MVTTKLDMPHSSMPEAKSKDGLQKTKEGEEKVDEADTKNNFLSMPETLTRDQMMPMSSWTRTTEK